MNCLIKSKYKKELSHYASILGSEDAAYYVLAMNNGYTLDKNPDGSDSSLYQALLTYYADDEERAVLNMSVVFTPNFMNKHGDWTEGFNHNNGSEPPSITTLQGENLCDNQVVSQILQNTPEISRFGLLEQANELSRDEMLVELLNDDREAEIAQKMDEFNQQNPTATDEEQFRAKKQFEREYNLNKIQDAISTLTIYLQNTFGDVPEMQKFIQTLQQRAETGGVTERNNQTSFILINLLKRIINNDDLSTTVSDFADAYIRAFYDTKEVQDALDIVAKEIGTKSTERVVRHLVKYVTGKLTNDKTLNRHEKLRRFWEGFKNLMRRITFRKLKDYNIRSNIMDAVVTAFAANTDLQRITSEEILYDITNSELDPGSHKATRKTVIEKMLEGLESRIKSIKSISNNGLINKDELFYLESLVQRIKDSKRFTPAQQNKQDLILIDDFIRNGIREMNQTLVRLQSIHNALSEQKFMHRYGSKNIDVVKYQFNGDEIPTIAELMKIKTDIVGFYSSLIKNQFLEYMKNTDEEDLQPGGYLYEAIKLIETAANEVNTSLEEEIARYSEYVVDKIADEYVDVGNKERFKLNAKKHLKNQINRGDLPWIETIIGSGISSQSPIVRMADIRLRDINTSVRTQSYTKGMQLLNLYDKAVPFLSKFSPTNFQRNFIELDENGKPTGYFVSPVKEGQARQNIKKLRERLNKKYEITQIDDSSKTPTSFEDDAQWKAYMDEYDRGLEDLGIHRRYVADYYIEQRKYLSKDTIDTLNSLQQQISKYYDKCYDEEIGVPILTDLTRDDREKLDALLREKQQLSNPYVIEYDSVTHQIVSIIPKTGDDLKTALEIMAWNKRRSENISYKSNFDKYNQAHQKLVDKYGANSREVKMFEYQNLTKRISPEYYELIESILGKQQLSPKLEELYAKKNAILAAVRPKQGFVQPNLDLLSDEAWAELKDLDEQISAERERLGSPNISNDDWDAYYSLTAKKDVVKYGQNISYIAWLERQALSMSTTNPNALNQYRDKYFYTDAKGNVKPLSVFYYNSPTDSKFIEDNLLGVFSEIDDDSEWLDKEYDPKNSNHLQPDAVKYRNERYYELTDPTNKNYNKASHDFYNMLLDMMDEAWGMLPGLQRTSRYQMPQRRDRNSHLITRAGVWQNAKAAWSNTFQINENDVQYNDEYTRSPDGRYVYTVPIRWVRMLDEPSAISTDIIHSVTSFYQMALQYSEKSKLAPVLEMLKARLESTSVENQPSDQAKRLSKHLEMYLYDRKRTGFRKNRRMGVLEKFWAKMSQLLNSFAHSKLMPHNLIGILKNANDSFFSLMAEIIGGRHFTKSDFGYAIKTMGKEVIKGGLFSAGKTKKNCWTVQAMQYAGVSGTIEEIFKGKNETWLRRVIENHFSMGEYTFVDYMFKGLLTNMIYHNRRLMTNPLTGKQEFMTRQRAEYLYQQYSGTKEAGAKKWKKSDITLRDAYQVNQEGIFELKQEYTDIVKPFIGESGRRSNKAELQVNTTIKERSSVINGMLDEMDRNGLSQNYIGAMVLLMRGWMVTQLVDYTKTGHDFAVYSDDNDNTNPKNWYSRVMTSAIDSYKNQIVEEDEEFAGQLNLGTGIVEKGAWMGLLRAYWKWMKGGWYFRHFGNGYEDMSDAQLYQVRRANACMAAVTINVALGYLVNMWLEGLKQSMGDGDDDDKNIKWFAETKNLKELEWYIANSLQTFLVASTTERFTQVPFIGYGFALLELVQTISISTSYVKDLDALLDAGGDLAYMFGQLIGIYDPTTDGSDGSPVYQTVTRGSYQGMKNWQADFAKASSEIPILNELGVNNAIKSITVPAMQQKGNWYANTLPFRFYPMAQLSKTKKLTLLQTLLGYSEDELKDQQPKKKKKSKNKMVF